MELPSSGIPRLEDTEVASRPKNPMPKEDRAKQFMPFAALKGLDEALAAREKIVVPKKELSEEMLQELDEAMHHVTKGSMISVVYYYKDEYIKITGIVAKLDEDAGYVQVVNTKIPFADILEIKQADI